ncbi:hypothetical protein [Actinoallomurus sp. NPDC052274]|uniref:hypothetical protein n=1 Tax=Actinoallomurus sp. NPDC052274 TaxID=3155420 RepID=UPI003440B73B
MTGQEHYDAAEHLLSSAGELDPAVPGQQQVIRQLHAEAQVHATLAVADFLRNHKI